MKSICRNFQTIGVLLLLAGATNIQGATTYAPTGNGNWSAPGTWTPAGPAAGAGNVVNKGTPGAVVTLDTNIVIGVIRNTTSASSGTLTITPSGPVFLTMDNTGGAANPTGDLNAYIGTTSSGTIPFTANIIISNTDLDISQQGSTQPALVIGAASGNTITAATAGRTLFLLNNTPSGSSKDTTINSSIGATGSSITISNMGTSVSGKSGIIAGPIGPNASVVENSAASPLRLSNGANNYTGDTTITLGILQLGANNAIPAVSTVNNNGTLNLVNFSDTINGLNGSGTVSAASGTPTLTIGGNGGSGSFAGVIQNAGGTLSVTKTGSGTEVLSGANTYSGTTTFNGGFLNAGVADGGSGPFGSGGFIAFGGGTLQYSGLNNFDYSPRFSTAANNFISIDTAGQAVTFATALTSSGGSLKLTNSTGIGTLTLTAAATYSGNTTINGGTLILGSGGAIAANSTLNIGAGGTFDVSALASPYTFGTSATLKASGAGILIGTNAATIVGAAGGIFDLGSQPITLTWNGAAAGTDNTHPSLLISQGTLNLNTNPITIVVPGAALDTGVYTLISAPAITGTAPNPTASYTGGNGVAVGKVGVISISGTSVILTVTAAAGNVGTWTNDVDGNWSDATKWSSNPNVPHLAGDAATLGVGTALRTVTLNADETVGILSFTNANSFVVANAGKTLKLDNTGSGASVTVTGGTANNVQTSVALNDNVVVTVGSGKSLAFSGIVSNTAASKTLLFNGPGTNILSGVNSYGPAAGSVGTTVNAGGTLRLGNGGALGAGDLSLSGNSKLQAGTAVSVGNNIAIADLTTVDNNGNNFILGGVISGIGGLTKINNGTLTLNGNNSYGGDTTVNAGILSISSAANVASPNIILNGGDLLGNGTFTATNNIGIGSPTVGTNAFIDAASGQAFTLSGVIGSAGNGGTDGLIVNSGAGNNGTVILAGANTLNGTTIIANGALQLANPLALQNSTLNYNTGTLLFDSSISTPALGRLSGTVAAQEIGLTNTVAGPVTLTAGGNNVASIYGGNLTGSGGFTKAGSGSMTLSNINYTGGTAINTGSGAVTILGGNFGSSSSPITVGAQLNLTGGTATASTFNLAIAGGQTGVGASINGTANLTNTFTTIGSGANTAGPMTLNTSGNVNLGDVKINKDQGTGSGLIVAGGNVFAASINVGQSGTAARAADLSVTGGTLTIADATQTGKFAIHSGAGNGALTMSGGALNYLGTDGLQMSVGAGPSVASITGGTATLSGITLNSGSVATTSTFTVNGTNAALYLGSGGLIINAPSPTVAAIFGNGVIGALTDWTADAPITLTNNAIFKTADAANIPHSITLSNVLSGTGGFTKTGAGTLSLYGASTYTGNTVISNATLALIGTAGILDSAVIAISAGAVLDVSGEADGTLHVGADVANQTLAGTGTVNGSVNVAALGTISPGFSIGTLTAGGLVTLGGAAFFELNRSASPNSDKIISPAIAAGGTLTVTNIGSTALQTGDTFQLFSTPVTGAFVVTNLPASDHGFNYTWTNKLAVDGTIAVLSVVASVNTNSTSITNTFDGTNLTLSWPADHIGWRLQAQTNSLAVGLSTNWADVAGSTTTNQVVIPVNPSNGSVFFRLIYP